METVRGILYTVLGVVLTTLFTAYLQSSSQARISFDLQAINFPIPPIEGFPYTDRDAAEGTGFTRPTFVRLNIENAGYNQSQDIIMRLRDARIVFTCPDGLCSDIAVLSSEDGLYRLGTLLPSSQTEVYAVLEGGFFFISDRIQVFEAGQIVERNMLPPDTRDLFGLSAFSLSNPILSFYIVIMFTMISLVAVVSFSFSILARKYNGLYSYIYKKEDLERILKSMSTQGVGKKDEQLSSDEANKVD